MRSVPNVRSCPKVALHSGLVGTGGEVTGDDLKRARQSRRIPKAEVARQFSIDVRTLTRWEKKLPDSALPAVAGFLADLETGKAPEPLLSEATDAQLLAQLSLRLETARARRGRRQDDEDNVHPRDIPGVAFAQYDATAYANRANQRRTGS